MLDFGQVGQRREWDSKKWTRFEDDVISLPIADMDCIVAEPIQAALEARIQHGIFGYDHPPADAMDVITEHFRRRYEWDVSPEWIVPVAGVVPAQFVAQRAFASRSGSTSIPNPIYHSFPQVPGITDSQPSPIAMHRDSQGRDVLDIPAFADSLAAGSGVAHLCNPHNPGGAVYGLAELQAIADAATESDTVLVSDEIWADLILDDLPHLPMAKIAPDHAISILAATKTWNIAGLSLAFAVIPNAALRAKFQRALMGYPSISNLAWRATLAAYRDGEAWRQSLLTHLRSQRQMIQSLVDRHPKLSMPRLQGTYLAWVDCTELNTPDLHARCVAAGVGPDEGEKYGKPAHLRFNLGCSSEMFQEALARFEGVIDAL